ncbi:uncharacterized protein LOC134805149 [Cydia splendana]|uniref:uncharacterized protein LOC134805149 n=1 Tax=Cydia splendana TaxID=1100963 RepID=UPI00300CD85E
MDELRSKHKSLHNAAHHIALECINPQSHSPYHVHPYPSPVRLQHAFQSQNSPKMFHPKGLKPHIDGRAYSTPNDSPILGRALCLTPRGSPLPGRVSHLSDKFQDSLTLASDTDALVAKISTMFPTVSETHIKILLKKYYNREAVVISALQVEKHPITTPGPLTMSPMAARMQKGAMGVYSALQLAKGVSGSIHSAHFTPLTGTPQGSPSLLRPASGASSHYGARSTSSQPTRHQSPKMKLKYLKSVFPKAEETLILDVLANKDNNVQKASEELLTMGFTKKAKTLILDVLANKDNNVQKASEALLTMGFTKKAKTLILDVLANKDNNVQKASEELLTMGFTKKAKTLILDVLANKDNNVQKASEALLTMGFTKKAKTLILDVLANKDNNVQKASEELLTMGFTKKAKTLILVVLANKDNNVQKASEELLTMGFTKKAKTLILDVLANKDNNVQKASEELLTMGFTKKAKETLILDVLANKDNNVQKASEELLTMGFTKKAKTLILDVLANKDNNVQKASEELLTMGFTKKATFSHYPIRYRMSEETLILDVLANKDNNVQKASEELLTMGFTKKEIVKKKEETPQPVKKVVTIVKTAEEKNELKKKLQKKYSSVAERVISIALDSVDYNEERAEQILAAVLTEEPKIKTEPTTPKRSRTPEVKPPGISVVGGIFIEDSFRCVDGTIAVGRACVVGGTIAVNENVASVRQTAQPAVTQLSSVGEVIHHNKQHTLHLYRNETASIHDTLDVLDDVVTSWPILKTSVADTKYKSQYTVAGAGPNPVLRRGPKDNLLLEDYMAWKGPNPDLRKGPCVRPSGPEPRERGFSLARGPAELASGPAGLNKGSIYQKMNKKTAKM